MTETQAKFIARAWGNGGEIAYSETHASATQKVCKREGWIVPTAKGGRYANGDEYIWHEVSHAGLVALASKLSK
jgi:hypothetical protein